MAEDKDMPQSVYIGTRGNTILQRVVSNARGVLVMAFSGGDKDATAYFSGTPEEQDKILSVAKAFIENRTKKGLEVQKVATENRDAAVDRKAAP